MKLTISVSVDGRYAKAAACMDLPEPLVMAFEPLKTTDDQLLSVLFNEPMPSSVAAKRVLKLREESAKEIADTITTYLMKVMSEQDTHNGYAK